MNNNCSETPFPLLASALLLLPMLSWLCGCRPAIAESAKPPPQPVAVTIAKAQRGPIVRSIILPGEIKPYQMATLYAKVTGYLKTITVDKGDPVKTGALLAEIEVPELLADAAKYRAEVEVAGTDYKRTSEAIKKAPDLVTPLAVDTAKGNFDMAKASLERAETLLQFTKITAPFTGVVTRRLVDPGAFIPAATSGSTAQNAALLTLMDFNTVRLQVAVPELEASHVAKGLPVTITVDGLPGRQFEAQITRFAYALDDLSKTMLAEIEVPNPQLALRPGMYASVKIGIEKRPDALLVPVEALVREKANAFVFVPQDNQARKVAVKTGFNDGHQVEILSGLKPDATIILVGKRTLTDGQAVAITGSK